MNCRSAEPLLSAFLEDDLSQNERRTLEAHLMSCRRCSHAVRGLRATLEVLQYAPTVDTGPHFEADLLTRIRSGEGLRPGVIEWLRGYLEPARLRPVFLAGAGACAIWIAVLIVGSNGVKHPSNVSTIADGGFGLNAAPTVSAPPNGGAPSIIDRGPLEPSGVTTVASRSSQDPAAVKAAPTRSTPPAGYAWADHDYASTKSGQDSMIPNPGSRYDDEYITDQFILERGLEGSNSRTITPVSDRPSDDVFITF